MMEYLLTLNASAVVGARNGQPTAWAHSRAALDEKLVALTAAGED